MKEEDKNAVVSQIMCAYPTWMHNVFDITINLGLLESLTKRCREVFADQFTNPNSCFDGFVLKNQEDTVGHIWLYQQENDTTGKLQAQILSIYIRPDYRGKWLYKRLIIASEEWAISKGCCALAGMVVDKNIIAIKSALREGFHITRYEVYKPLN